MTGKEGQKSTLRGLFTTLAAEVSTSAQTTKTSTFLSPVAFTYTRDLTLGASGQDVSALQTFLITNGYQIPAGATGYFGPQTQSALIQYQKAKNISPAVGYFGPITRAMLNTSSSPSDEAQSVPTTDFFSASSLTPEEMQSAIIQIRTKLASLIQQLIVLLQQQVSNM